MTYDPWKTTTLEQNSALLKGRCFFIIWKKNTVIWYNFCIMALFSPLFQGTKYITRPPVPVPPPPVPVLPPPHVLGRLHMYLASCQVASCQLKLASCRLPASCQTKLSSCKLPACCKVKLADKLSASADSSCQLKLASCRLTASCQVKFASWKLPGQVGKLQVARSSWQASCWQVPAQVASSSLQVARSSWQASCWQVLARVASSSWQVSSCQQVAWSSWQASCWLKLAIFQVKLTCNWWNRGPWAQLVIF